MKKAENGSAHILVIVLLVVALLAALGFIFWQNISKSQTSLNKNTDSAKIEKSVNPAPEHKYLTIAEWGVRMEVKDGQENIIYAKDTRSGIKDYFGLGTSKLDASGQEYCVTSEGPLGHIQRTTEKSTAEASAPEPLNNEMKIDGYYYYYQSPQSACSDNVELSSEQTAAIKSAKEMVKTIRSIND